MRALISHSNIQSKTLLVDEMSGQKPQEKSFTKWATLRGVTSIVLFLIITFLAELLVVLYAMSIGIQDPSLLQTTGQFPGTDWTVTLTLSPLFHLVPIGVILTLAFSWVYLTPYVARRRPSGPVRRERKPKLLTRVKARLLRVKAIAYLTRRFSSAQAVSAFGLIFVFVSLVLIFSLIAFPSLLYDAVSGAYKTNPAFLGCVKGTSGALSPIGQAFAPVNDALRGVASGFAGFVLALGVVARPLVLLDDAGKYLVFQNAAAWVPAFAALFYGEYRRRGYLLRRARKT
jgi:hypothetical protein